jgi:hypothetical protein
MVQVVERLPSKREALSSNSSATKKTNKQTSKDIETGSYLWSWAIGMRHGNGKGDGEMVCFVLFCFLILVANSEKIFILKIKI